MYCRHVKFSASEKGRMMSSSFPRVIIEHDASLRPQAYLSQKFYTSHIIIIITMALLVDKHRPRSLDTLTYHHDLSDRLRSLVSRQSPFGPQSLTQLRQRAVTFLIS